MGFWHRLWPWNSLAYPNTVTYTQNKIKFELKIIKKKTCIHLNLGRRKKPLNCLNRQCLTQRILKPKQGIEMPRGWLIKRTLKNKRILWRTSCLKMTTWEKWQIPRKIEVIKLKKLKNLNRPVVLKCLSSSAFCHPKERHFVLGYVCQNSCGCE